jgi:hypothetical protein
MVVEISNADDPLFKTVRFQKKIKIKKVPCLEDIGRDQIQATCYNKKDFADMWKQISRDASRLLATLNDKMHCLIGLKAKKFEDSKANLLSCKKKNNSGKAIMIILRY